MITDQNKVNPDGTRGLVNTVQLIDGQGNGGTVTNVYFTTNGTKNQTLYFAHTEEAAELAKQLQGTFAAKSSDDNNWESALSEAVRVQQEKSDSPGVWGQTYGCEKKDIRTNPGDDLYGEVLKEGEQRITGTLHYDVKFNCQFKPTFDQTRFNECVRGGRSETVCRQESTSTNTCKKDVFTSLGVFTKVPKAEEIWQRLVNGTMGVFKRFFPKETAGAPVEKIQEIPASTKVSYTSPGNETRAGDPSLGRRGETDAQLFFPYIGGLQEYFLKGIQEALRPKDLTAGETFSGSTPTDFSQCRSEWEGVRAGGFPSAIQLVFAQVSAKYNIPSCVLTGIANVEGSRMRNLTEEEADEITRLWTGSPEEEISAELLQKINCKSNFAGAMGPMQMTPGAFLPYKDASGSPNPSACNARDAIYAAAEFLTKGRLPLYGYSSTSPWSEPRKFCAAGQTYYGSCKLDRPTCNNLGNNYCDFLLNYCQADMNLPEAKCSDFFNADSR